MGIYFIAGGARSGKSGKGESLALSLSGAVKPLFIATAVASDQEMAERIGRHQEDRGDKFELLEEAKDLSGVLAQVDSQRTVLVDCLTLWLSNNLLDHGVDSNELVLTAARARQGDTIFISNEVGEGIVPMNALARQFRDLSGIMNQQFAAAADKVFSMKFGIAQELK
jgi:adenosylcobinamide kinase/adenosylcobinamide-phosphate guanylyltransferase